MNIDISSKDFFKPDKQPRAQELDEFGIPVGCPCGGPCTLGRVPDCALQDRCHYAGVMSTFLQIVRMRWSIDRALSLSCLSCLPSFDPGESYSVKVVLGGRFLGVPKWEEQGVGGGCGELRSCNGIDTNSFCIFGSKNRNNSSLATCSNFLWGYGRCSAILTKFLGGRRNLRNSETNFLVDEETFVKRQ